MVGTQQFPELTMLDTCDPCGYTDGVAVARAYVRVVKDGKDLLFCGHHFVKHGGDLLAGGWTVHEDRREQLDVKPGASA